MQSIRTPCVACSPVSLVAPLYAMTAQEHILVIEDEEHLAVGIKYNLEAEGYRVTTLGTGQDGLDCVQKDPTNIDLVILDLMLPEMSGYAVCESLRAAGHGLPVLILSARSMPEDRAQGFNVGADQYMTKPFDLDELISRVKNLLARHRDDQQPTPSNLFNFGNAQVNFAEFAVTIDEETTKLTKLEMKLLEYFVSNEGRVIPRAELLENVWNVPSRLNTRAPDQFIRRLRKLFESNPSQPQHFLTIRDAGYRFVAEP